MKDEKNDLDKINQDKNRPDLKVVWENKNPIKKYKRLAIYLFRHGSYSEPHLIDLQYERISRFFRVVRNDVLAVEFNIDRSFEFVNPVYVDISRNLYSFDWAYFPALARLISDYQNNLFDAVCIDMIGDQPTSSVCVNVVGALSFRGIPVINTSDGKCTKAIEDALEIKNSWLSGALSKEDDFSTFFPKLQAYIMIRLREQVRRLAEDSGLKRFTNEDDFISYLINRLDKSPYISGNIPNISELSREIEWQIERKEIENRKRTELVYLISHGDVKLRDEVLPFGQPRTEEEISELFDRLCKYGFKKVRKGNMIVVTKTFTINEKIFTVYVDPLVKGKIVFNIVKEKDNYSYRRTYILDNWDYNKIDERIKKEIQR